MLTNKFSPNITKQSNYIRSTSSTKNIKKKSVLYFLLLTTVMVWRLK